MGHFILHRIKVADQLKRNMPNLAARSTMPPLSTDLKDTVGLSVSFAQSKQLNDFHSFERRQTPPSEFPDPLVQAGKSSATNRNISTH